MGIAQNILPRPVTTIWQKEDCLDRPLFTQTLRNYQPSVSLLHRTPEDYHERVNQRSTSHLTPMILILQVGRNIPWTTMTLNPEKQKTLKKPLKSCNGHLVYDYFRLGVGCHWQMWRVTFSSRLNCCRRMPTGTVPSEGVAPKQAPSLAGRTMTLENGCRVSLGRCDSVVLGNFGNKLVSTGNTTTAHLPHRVRLVEAVLGLLRAAWSLLKNKWTLPSLLASDALALHHMPWTNW